MAGLEVADGGEVLGVVAHFAGSTTLGSSGCSSEELGTFGGLTSLPRRTAFSSDVGEVPHSSSLDLRRDTSTMSSSLRVIMGLYTFEVLMLSHRECLL